MVIEDTRVSPRRQSIALIFVSIFCFFLFGSVVICCFFFFFFSSRRRHTRSTREWSSDVCSSDLELELMAETLRSQFKRLGALHHDDATFATAENLRQCVALFERVARVPRFTPAVWSKSREGRSEERRVGKECRKGWWVWCEERIA